MINRFLEYYGTELKQNKNSYTYKSISSEMIKSIIDSDIKKIQDFVEKNKISEFDFMSSSIYPSYCYLIKLSEYLNHKEDALYAIGYLFLPHAVFAMAVSPHPAKQMASFNAAYDAIDNLTQFIHILSQNKEKAVGYSDKEIQDIKQMLENLRGFIKTRTFKLTDGFKIKLNSNNETTFLLELSSDHKEYELNLINFLKIYYNSGSKKTTHILGM